MSTKKALAFMAALSVLSAPAAAQSWRVSNTAQRQIQNDISQLSNQINRATQNRRISQREATQLRRDAVNLQRNLNRFSRDGLDRNEVAQLERATNSVRQQLRLERRDWDGRRN
jgi:septal ring factor EnvC (AmiA/AmiB activator)